MLISPHNVYENRPFQSQISHINNNLHYTWKMMMMMMIWMKSHKKTEITKKIFEHFFLSFSDLKCLHFLFFHLIYWTQSEKEHINVYNGPHIIKTIGIMAKNIHNWWHNSVFTTCNVCLPVCFSFIDIESKKKIRWTTRS